jgi:hypothetical protein
VYFEGLATTLELEVTCRDTSEVTLLELAGIRARVALTYLAMTFKRHRVMVDSVAILRVASYDKAGSFGICRLCCY